MTLQLPPRQTATPSPAIPPIATTLVPTPIPSELIVRREPWPIVVALLAGFMLGYAACEMQDVCRRHDKQEQKEKQDDSKPIDPKDESAKVEAKGATFVFVYEFQTKTVEQTKLMDALPAWCTANQCEFRQYDRDLSDSETYRAAASKAGVSDPFLAVVRNRKIVRVFEMPRDRIALDQLVK